MNYEITHFKTRSFVQRRTHSVSPRDFSALGGENHAREAANGLETTVS